jgi:hypothetical protein
VNLLANLVVRYVEGSFSVDHYERSSSDLTLLSNPAPLNLMRNTEELSGRQFCTVFLLSKGHVWGGVDHALRAKPSVSKHGRTCRRVSTSQDAFDHDISVQSLRTEETGLNRLRRGDNNAL